MNRYSRWPFAAASESNLIVATVMWLFGWLLYLITGSKLVRLFAFLMTPIWLLVLYFFRDPDRQVLVDEGLVVSPADGEVVAVVAEREPRYLGQETVRVSIFLNITDVHVQRVPIGGTVRMIQHVPGEFKQAFRPEASDVNEYLATMISTPHGPILIKQIAGILARRCVTYLEAGEVVTTGQRLGLIRFGSRVDLFLPAETEIVVEKGDKVFGGLTPLARLKR